MGSKNVEAHKAAHEAFNRRDYIAMVKDLTIGFTYVDHPRDITMKTRDEFKGWSQDWVAAFSDAAITEAQYIDGGDTTIALCVGRGANDGPLGPLPKTGRRVSIPFCEVLRWDKSGKTTGGAAYYDQLTLLVQLGHAKPAPSI